MKNEGPYQPNQLLQFFAYDHLPEDKRKISKLFSELAVEIDKNLPNNVEKNTSMRRLLEAKDCAVRSTFFYDW